MSVSATDEYTMRSCHYVLKHCANGLPKGETLESVSEIIEVHRHALHLMPQRRGKGALVLELGQLAKRFSKGSSMVEQADTEHEAVVSPVAGSTPAPCDPRDEPLMREAKEIFNGGTWVDDPRPAVPELDLFR